MTRAFVIALGLLAACRDAGTVSIESPANFSTCGALDVHAYLVAGANCDTCTCASCGVCSGNNSACTHYHQTVDGRDTRIVPLDEIPEGGIVLQPPHSGHYAAIYEYLNAGDLVTVLCVEIDVDADGTASSSAEAETPGCCSASAAGEPLGE